VDEHRVNQDRPARLGELGHGEGGLEEDGQPHQPDLPGLRGVTDHGEGPGVHDQEESDRPEQGRPAPAPHVPQRPRAFEPLLMEAIHQPGTEPEHPQLFAGVRGEGQLTEVGLPTGAEGIAADHLALGDVVASPTVPSHQPRSRQGHPQPPTKRADDGRHPEPGE
jgi:hypothetical protein